MAKQPAALAAYRARQKSAGKKGGKVSPKNRKGTSKKASAKKKS